MRTQGRKEKTVKDRVSVLEELFSSLGECFSIDDLFSYMARLSPDKRDHVRKAVRLLARYTGQKQVLELLEGGWAGRPGSDGGAPPISLEQTLRAVELAAQASPRYAVYLAALLVSGYRPDHLLKLRWRDEALPRVFDAERYGSGTKRATYAFLTPRVYDVIRSHAPCLEPGCTLFSFQRREEQEAKKLIREEIPSFRPYSLRSLHGYLLTMKRWPEQLVNYVEGRAAKSVLRKYYLDKQLAEALEELREEHDKALGDVDEKLAQLVTANENV